MIRVSNNFENLTEAALRQNGFRETISDFIVPCVQHIVARYSMHFALAEFKPCVPPRSLIE